MDPTFTKFSGL